MATYSGSFDNENWYQTFKDGQPFSAVRSLKIRDHSPDGFSWSYCGSGCAQFALGVLLEETDQETAEHLYQDFKFKVIALLPPDSFAFTSKLVQKYLSNPNEFILTLEE